MKMHAAEIVYIKTSIIGVTLPITVDRQRFEIVITICLGWAVFSRQYIMWKNMRTVTDESSYAIIIKLSCVCSQFLVCSLISKIRCCKKISRFEECAIPTVTSMLCSDCILSVATAVVIAVSSLTCVNL